MLPAVEVAVGNSSALTVNVAESRVGVAVCACRANQNAGAVLRVVVVAKVTVETRLKSKLSYLMPNPLRDRAKNSVQ